ncbi:hypothetical protein KKB_05023 [Kingella kingae PYKK081]|nr:hypothetical protein KKB_05023 [Kingella kingae PYKK081]
MLSKVANLPLPEAYQPRNAGDFDATREILPTFCKINPLTIYFIPCNKVSNPAYCKQDFLQLCKLSNLIAGYYL